jgi:biotin synthase
MNYLTLADKALNDEPLTRDECRSVLTAPDNELLALLHAAFQVRSTYFGRTVRLQMLQNAKSGACQEDCHYCSQSSISTAPIERYNLLPQKQMMEGARQAAAAKAQRYCIVISGRSPLDREIDEIAGAVRSIKEEVPIQICCSLGLMSESPFEHQRSLPRVDLHDPHLPRPAGNDQERARGGIGNLLRWHRWYG